MHHLQLLLILLLSAAAASDNLYDVHGNEFMAVGSYRYRDTVLSAYHSGDGPQILEPYISWNISENDEIRKNLLRKGFYFTVPLSVDSIMHELSRPSSIKVLQLQSFQVSLRSSISASLCKKDCGDISAAGFRSASGTFKVLFRCKSHIICKRMFWSLYFNSADSEFVRSAFEFNFSGVAGASRFHLKKLGLPVSKSVMIPLRNDEWFEGNKVLLFSIKAECGKPAYESFVKDLGYKMPADGSMPDVYRSPLLNNLAAAVSNNSQWQMVAEMRTEGKMVAQAVFNVGYQQETLTATNWFSPCRLESSFPFQVGHSSFNFFSVAGDTTYKRRFFINNNYGGCHLNIGLFIVIDQKDPCSWGNGVWKGREPVLVYNTAAGRPYESGGVRYADQFLVYLRYSLPSLTPPAVNPFRNDFEFERGKLLLFTVKAHSNTKAYNAYTKVMSRNVCRIPADGSLPTVYRSDFLENLPAALSLMGKHQIVAEMRTGGKAVAQIVFHPHDRSFDKFSWFTQANVVSSFPIRINAGTKFNVFSIPGGTYKEHRRRFSVEFNHGGCDNDRGFWVVIDSDKHCHWERNAFKGSGPGLVYGAANGLSYYRGGIRYADRFLIYLQ